MEESKELQKLYGFMQAFIYITVCIEILLFVHFGVTKPIHQIHRFFYLVDIGSDIFSW